MPKAGGDRLRRHPEQAVAWADAICHNHGRNNYARIIFVATRLEHSGVSRRRSIEVNSDQGAQTLLNLAAHGIHFERAMVQKTTAHTRCPSIDSF